MAFMSKWKFGATKILLVLIVAVSFFGFQTSAFAASVGNQLTGPEAGWKRVNATPQNNFYFDNTWVNISQYSLYQGTSNSKVSFSSKELK
jgi:intracellular septation protein A